MVVKIYYWPFLGRAGAAIRMLKEAGVSYEHVVDMAEISQKCAAFGAPTGTIAPPMLEDGDMSISQSGAVTMYVGKKYGFEASDDCKALQLMDDIKDLIENGLGKSNEDAKKLKAYLNGDGSGKPSRFSLFAGALERNVQGPFFFGDKMSYVDFFWASAYEMSYSGSLKRLEAKTGVDIFAPYPKLMAIAKTIGQLESMKGSDLIAIPEKFGMKDQVIEEYIKL